MPQREQALQTKREQPSCQISGDGEICLDVLRDEAGGCCPGLPVLCRPLEMPSQRKLRVRRLIVSRGALFCPEPTCFAPRGLCGNLCFAPRSAPFGQCSGGNLELIVNLYKAHFLHKGNLLFLRLAEKKQVFFAVNKTHSQDTSGLTSYMRLC